MPIDAMSYFMTGQIKVTKKRKKNKTIEDDLREKVAKFLKFYKGFKVIYRIDFQADMRASTGLVAKNVRLQMKDKGYPDLFIAMKNKYYGGLYVELKKSKSEVYYVNGEFKKDDHLKDQLAMHERLREQGYKVVFCWDYDQFLEIFNEYFGIQGA